MAATEAAAEVARYIVTASNFSCEGGVFVRGDYVFADWMPGVGLDRLVAMELIAPAGSVIGTAPKAPGLPDTPSVQDLQAEAPGAHPDAPGLPIEAWEAIAALAAVEPEPDPAALEADATKRLVEAVDAPGRLTGEELKAAILDQWTVPVCLAYAAANPDQIETIVKYETLGKGRASLLRTLRQ